MRITAKSTMSGRVQCSLHFNDLSKSPARYIFSVYSYIIYYKHKLWHCYEYYYTRYDIEFDIDIVIVFTLGDGAIFVLNLK